MLFNDVLSSHYRERLEFGRTTGTGWLTDELAATYHKLSKEAWHFDQGVNEQTGITPRHPIPTSPCWEPMAVWCERWEDWFCIENILATDLLMQFPQLQPLHPSCPLPKDWPRAPKAHSTPIDNFKEQCLYLAECYSASVINRYADATNPQVAMAQALRAFDLRAPLVVWLHLFDAVDILGELDLTLTPPSEKWIDLNALWDEITDKAPYS